MTTEDADDHEVPQITQLHVRQLLSAQHEFAVLWINPKDVSGPLNLWDCNDPAPGIVAVRHGELIDALSDGGPGEPEALDILQDMVTARVAYTRIAED